LRLHRISQHPSQSLFRLELFGEIMPTLYNVTTGQIVARNVSRADGLLNRLLGFLPRAQVHPDDGLWFDQCSMIHMIGMRSRIDVVFLDKFRRVLRVDRSVSHSRIALACSRATIVVELGEAPPEGRDLLAGDELALE
jgi:uncharacterized protein